MLQNYNRYKILKVFLNNSTESFRLRELSRMSKLAPLSVMNYLKEFENGGLVKKYEKISIIYELHSAGLINYLWEKVYPEAIILYGSFSKGEAIEKSDIDLFIRSDNKKIDLSGFEKKIGREIHLFFEKDIKKLSKEFKNNLINGIILKGYLKI